MDFTIVTPSFQQLDHLACCIASVADQKGVSLEHLVQDGGTKGFAEFSQKMKERWPDRDGYRRRMVSEADGGMYEAINKGLKRGTGKICAYLNCDEQYLPGALATIRQIFSQRMQVEIVQAAFLVIDEKNRLVTQQRPVKLFWPHIATSHLPNFTCATFFKRSLLENGKAWFDESLLSCADAVWNLDRLRSGNRFFYSRSTVSVFRQTRFNRGLTPEGLAERQKIVRAMPEWVRRGAPFLENCPPATEVFCRSLLSLRGPILDLDKSLGRTKGALRALLGRRDLVGPAGSLIGRAVRGFKPPAGPARRRAFSVREWKRCKLKSFSRMTECSPMGIPPLNPTSHPDLA